MQLEVKQIAKTEKETPAGMEVTVFKCVLKGGETGISTVKATLTLESPDHLELQRFVNQQIGEQVNLSLQNLNHRLAEYEKPKTEA